MGSGEWTRHVFVMSWAPSCPVDVCDSQSVIQSGFSSVDVIYGTEQCILDQPSERRGYETIRRRRVVCMSGQSDLSAFNVNRRQTSLWATSVRSTTTSRLMSAAWPAVLHTSACQQRCKHYTSCYDVLVYALCLVQSTLQFLSLFGSNTMWCFISDTEDK